MVSPRGETGILTRKLRFLAGTVLCSAVTLSAQVVVDKTCAACSRLKNDSLNLLVRNIRVNQVGYLPDDPNKAAFVANPSSQTFSVVEASTRKTVFTGTLKDVGSYTEGAMAIYSYYNSITPLDSLIRPAVNDHLYRADFSAFTTPGVYLLTCGSDTSSHFSLDPKVYNYVFETSLKFFGAQRCGDTHSWMHKACHLKDGDFLGPQYAGALTGGWHDCGDHIKVGETIGYAASVLAMTYVFFPQKAEDFFGASYSDTLPFGNDGIPDVLYEAKIGADFILKLYKVSKQLGLIDQGDMYHSIIDLEDHQYWDVPEHQDLAPHSKGGPPRTPRAGIGANVAGMYAAALAFFSWGWEPFDPAYAQECLAAATDIYDKIVIPKRGTPTLNEQGLYTGGGETRDDEALAALALWYATKDPRFRKDLLENTALGSDNTAQFNQGIFPAGLLAYGNGRPFAPGGWTSDYQNTFVYVLYGLSKLIVGNHATAAAYGISATVADSLNQDAVAALKRLVQTNSNGSTTYGAIHADEPYHGVFTSVAWGFNRYNMGTVMGLFFYWDLTHDPLYYNIGIDNLNYILGMNPWDISFIMGTGEKNLQHPHNRAANPEGYNAGGLPYDYTCPKGALMGGASPDSGVLIDKWDSYVNTETCIDFSAQLITSLQMLAMDLPPDTTGPKFRNVNIFPDVTTALVIWSTDEISRDTLFVLDAPGGKVLQTLPDDSLARNHQITVSGLTANTTYYVYFAGIDIHNNYTVDKNNGQYWKFTTKAALVPAAITQVKVCNETDQSAMVTWWTRNGYYSSEVDYGKTTALGQTQSPDDAGIPTMFHQVTLQQLDAATLYYFQVVSGATTDNNAGNFYNFSTTQVLVDYTIRIKPTNKDDGGKGTHFYIDVTNNENRPYYGLELRFYFTADATTAHDLVARGFDHQRFDVGGVAIPLNITYGAAQQVPGTTDQWYFPITLNDTLSVASRARFDLQINSGGPNGYNDQPFSFFQNAWSIRAHTQPPDPVDFGGVDLSLGANGVYTGPDMVETVNGKAVISYTEDPYITAYYQGVHVFGYGPDYTSDVLQVKRQAALSLTLPVATPQDRLDLRQENDTLTLAGRASSTPDGHIDEIVINGTDLPAAEMKSDSAGQEVSFSHLVNLTEGTNVFDVIAWDTAHCAFQSRKLIVNWSKAPPLPPPQADKPVANPPGQAGHDSLVVALSSTTPGAAIWYTEDGTDPAPGGSGSTLYTGVLTLKNQVTLKAIAVAAGFSPSDIMVETYDVLPYQVANIRTATLVDNDADGYADEVVIALDTTQGAPSLAVVAAQLQGAKLTSNLVAGAFTLTGDTIRLALAKNLLWVQDGVEKLTLPPPAQLQDGMLRPGDFTLRDGVAPVLRRAVLHPGLAGNPDSLLVVFSEAVHLDGIGSPFTVLRTPDSLTYAFNLAAGTQIDTLSLAAGETAYLLPVRSVTGPGNAAVTPQTGDWVWIDPAAGVADNVGNSQANPANARVPLQVEVTLAESMRIIADARGISHVVLGMPGPWTVYGGPQIQGTFGAGASLPVYPTPPDLNSTAGLIVESTAPFVLTLWVHSNLGEFVNKVTLNVDAAEFNKLELGDAPGSRRLHLLWNGASHHGDLVGTGAYVFMWDMVFFPTGEPAHRVTGKRIVGILRSQ